MIKLLALLFGVVMLLTGCGREETGRAPNKEPDTLVKSDRADPRCEDEATGCLMQLKGLYHEGDRAELVLTNKSDKPVYTGVGFILYEKDAQNNWQTVDMGVAFTDNIVTLDPHGQQRDELEKGLLTAGRTYKIEKNLSSDLDQLGGRLELVFDYITK